MNRFGLRIAIALVLAASAALPARAQTTGGTIAGRVTSTGGKPVPGAAVYATLTSTGARYGALTNDDGRYIIANVRSGGPYVVMARRVGFKPETHENVFVALGNTARVDITMTEVATQLGTVSVMANAAETMTQRTGPSTNVGRDLIENLPS